MQQGEAPAKKDFSTEKKMVGEFELMDSSDPSFYDNANYHVGEEEEAWRRIRKADERRRKFKLK